MLFVLTIDKLGVVFDLHVFVVFINSCQAESHFSFLLEFFEKLVSAIHLAIFVFVFLFHGKWLFIRLKNRLVKISHNGWMLICVQFDFHCSRIIRCITSMVLRLTFSLMFFLLLNLLLGCRLRLALLSKSSLTRISFCCRLGLFLFNLWRCRSDLFFLYFACIHLGSLKWWL